MEIDGLGTQENPHAKLLPKADHDVPTAALNSKCPSSQTIQEAEEYDDDDDLVSEDEQHEGLSDKEWTPTRAGGSRYKGKRTKANIVSSISPKKARTPSIQPRNKDLVRKPLLPCGMKFKNWSARLFDPTSYPRFRLRSIVTYNEENELRVWNNKSELHILDLFFCPISRSFKPIIGHDKHKGAAFPEFGLKIGNGRVESKEGKLSDESGEEKHSGDYLFGQYNCRNGVVVLTRDMRKCDDVIQFEGEEALWSWLARIRYEWPEFTIWEK